MVDDPTSVDILQLAVDKVWDAFPQDEYDIDDHGIIRKLIIRAVQAASASGKTDIEELVQDALRRLHGTDRG